MSSSTSTLELFKYDTSTDGKEVFSINTALNANWDKIDSFASAIKSLSNLDAQGEKRFTDIQNSLANKLEADVLLEENGYIKFNTSIGHMLQFGRASGGGKDCTVNLHVSYTSAGYAVSICPYYNGNANGVSYGWSCSRTGKTVSAFKFSHSTAYDYWYWITFGY